MNDLCRQCALIAAALLATGCNHSYRGSVTAAQSFQAREALCQAAQGEHEDGYDLALAAVSRFNNQAAIGTALFDYQSGLWDENDNCWPRLRKGRIAELLHQHRGQEAS